MLAPALALLLCAAPVPPERLADAAAGYAIALPRGWSAELVGGAALSASGPDGQRAVFAAARANGWSARELATALATGLQGVIVQEAPLANGHALVVDLGGPPAVDRGLVLVAASGERALVAVLSARAKSFAKARPALLELARSVEVVAPPPTDVPGAAVRPLTFEPFHETGEGAFSGELPEGWERELSAGVVGGERAYARASAIGRSPEHASAFVLYKLATFREPVPGRNAEGRGTRAYLAGGDALEKYLFRAVARADAHVGEWQIVWRGGPQPLFAHPTGVRFDGEEVEYAYRYRGERLLGRAYVVTYRMPEEPSGLWFLYGLYGWEAPAAQLASARRAGLELLRTFRFEDRFAAQADLFWVLARDSAQAALSVDRPHAAAAFSRRDEPRDSFESAAISLRSAAGAREPPRIEPSQFLAAPGDPLPAPAFPSTLPLR